MKQKFYFSSALLCAGLLIANSANAQWTHNGANHTTYLSNSSDSVGIGTTTPKFKLDVRATGIATIQVKSSSDNASLLLDRGTSGSTSSVTYRTAGGNNWQTGCVTNNNYTLRNNI